MAVHQQDVAREALWLTPALAASVGTRVYFEEADSLSCQCLKIYAVEPRSVRKTLRFRKSRDKDVLEIGTDLGTHTELLSTYCKSFTGITR